MYPEFGDVMPAEAGIQSLRSLDPGQKHAGMTIVWDSNEVVVWNGNLLFGSIVYLCKTFTGGLLTGMQSL